jgi:glyoxylase-like metal-dependent hydrolase (beta-lactamase superfamily II)
MAVMVPYMGTDVPEQPADWTEPGAYLVAPGVHRIPLPLPHDSLRAVNVYALQDPAGLVLVDSGWALRLTEQALGSALRQLGHELGDVAHVLVTHAHGDHYTQAIKLREVFGTRISIGLGERPNIERVFEPGFGGYDDQYAQLVRYGAPELAKLLDQWATEAFDREEFVWGRPDGWLADGEPLRLRDRNLDVIATPGHTRGHVVLRDQRAGLLFSGDHVLPHITPSIGFEPTVTPAPLRSYLASLELVRDLPDTLLLPAHGPVTASVHTRVDELLRHHEQRLAACLAAVQAGRGTAYEVARELRWTRRERLVDDLDTFNQMLAVIETGAHLDVLVLDGTLAVTEEDGVRCYTTVSAGLPSGVSSPRS